MQWIFLNIRKHLHVLMEKLENKGAVREGTLPHGKFVFWGQKPNKTVLTSQPDLKNIE